MYHLKFYADCPQGEKNKLFCYGVHDGKHAADLLARFIAKDFRIKAAFVGSPGERGNQLSKVQLTFISNVATVSSLYVKYPPQLEVPTTSKADQLAPGQFTSGRTANSHGYQR
jgi:hypothetical protein